MSNKTLTRADLSETVFRKLGLSRTESSALVDMVLEEMCNTIASGQSVKISSFGSFLVRDKDERVGRNPKTGVEVPISPRKVTVFKPSNVLKERVLEAHESKRGADTDEAFTAEQEMRAAE
ncbi:integration host factor subunit alpha [Fulvimarina endophytica]|uniref:Integration host factor subunit alpha n=1 Tax=Fulvimarina endophytica TaxID=2293836 RepID=A0A371X7F3_9HYPH|nr:integration host factor subunit alpha [Fulvimarina endophytica]